MKIRNKYHILFLLLLIVGLGAIGGSYWFRARTLSQIDRMLVTHVNAVATLVKKSVSQGTWSTATIYWLYEEQLITASHLLSALGDNDAPDASVLDAEQIALFLPSLSATPSAPWPDERWGNVPENMRQKFKAEMRIAPLYELLENDLMRQNGLVCMVYETGADRGVLCRDDTELNQMKKDSGIGPLLDDLVKAQLSWVVLQDAEGILAAAPKAASVSRWQDDVVLRKVAARGEPIHRRTEIDGVAHMEALSPFPMVDDTTAVLRVAVDAGVFYDISQAAHRRHYVTVIMIMIIELLLLGIAFAFRGWQKKRAAIEQTLARQQEERRHWELIGGLSATVAHEVRNPIHTISMTRERLKYEFSVPDEERADFEHLLQIVEKETTQLNKIVTDFLELGKPNRLQFEPTVIGEFVSERAAHSLPRATTEDKDIRTVIETSETAEIDPGRFQQVLTNLINNALDASVPGDCITVRVFHTDSDVVVHIVDAGAGMTDEQLEKALTPFVSFKANGTGLGLALVARLIRLHRGQFALKPNEDRGMTAEIRIPRFRLRKGTQ